MIRSALISAGVSETIASLPPEEIAKMIPGRMREFLEETRHGDLWVISPRISPAREIVIAYAVTISPRMRTAGLSLSKTIDSRFDREEKASVDAKIADNGILVFRIDDVGDHKKIQSVMEEVVATRTSLRAPTIYVSDVSIVGHTGRYGSHVCKFFGEFKKSLGLKSGLVARYRSLK